jgi:hypothetical protein
MRRLVTITPVTRRRLQFTVRRLMLTVSVVAVAFGAWSEVARLRRVARGYREKVALYAEAERTDLYFFSMNPYPGNRFHLESAAYCSQLKRKYAAAARRPWWPVPADPVPPWELRRRPSTEFPGIKFPRSHVDLRAKRGRSHKETLNGGDRSW